MSEIAREQVVEYLKKISLIEASALVKELETVFGVSAAAPMGMAMPMMGAAAGGAPAEEKTEFDVILKESGEKKIEVIKAVRAATGLGLKEAKDLVESAPKPVKQGISKDEADKLKKDLEANGAKVEIK